MPTTAALKIPAELKTPNHIQTYAKEIAKLLGDDWVYSAPQSVNGDACFDFWAYLVHKSDARICIHADTYYGKITIRSEKPYMPPTAKRIELYGVDPVKMNVSFGRPAKSIISMIKSKIVPAAFIVRDKFKERKHVEDTYEARQQVALVKLQNAGVLEQFTIRPNEERQAIYFPGGRGKVAFGRVEITVDSLTAEQAIKIIQIIKEGRSKNAV